MRRVSPKSGGSRALLCLVAGLLAACPSGGEWQASGVVREVRAAEAQIKIEHGDIEGLMPAMTMSFDVADPALLEGVEPGQYVEFRLSRREGVFEIVALDAPASDSSGISGGDFDALARVLDPAPGFELVDQEGRPLSLAQLRGRPVLLDFIFTRCPGPCPVLTGIHLDVRRGLSAADREGVAFVSISLDPAHDTPEVLRAYAEARRIDTRGWSFATGDEAEVAAVVAAYGIGTIRQPDGNIDHTVATFLIDPQGRIVRRYLGVRNSADTIRGDIQALL